MPEADRCAAQEAADDRVTPAGNAPPVIDQSIDPAQHAESCCEYGVPPVTEPRSRSY